jgi:hypothetical protein
MIAIVVLTIGLMSGALLMANVYKSTVRSRYMALATQLASEELEDLNRWPSSTTFTDPHIAVPPSTNTCNLAGENCIGSLTQDCGPTTTPIQCGSTSNITYFDSVCLSTAGGQMSETYQMPCVGGNYVTVPYSPAGAAPQPICSATPPTVGMTFDRRWVIEANQPVSGMRRITVLVTLADLTIQPPVSFQMSVVRP